MKMTDGSVPQASSTRSARSTRTREEHWIVDIGAGKLADTPDAFDVIVMP
jgi:isocitrate dehydrogenase